MLNEQIIACLKSEIIYYAISNLVVYAKSHYMLDGVARTCGVSDTLSFCDKQ